MVCHLPLILEMANRAGYLEPANVNDIAPVTELGREVAAYFNLNIAEDPAWFITDREGEALTQFVVAHT